MKLANCPSCGANVSFQSAASIMAVCEFCKSTLIRHDLNLEDIGKMAELLEDHSLLQLASSGYYSGMHFTVIGRIQYRFGAGIWSEWYLLFDDGRNGWLSDAGGNYTVTFPTDITNPLPDFLVLRIGKQISLTPSAQEEPLYFEVTNIEQAQCVAGAGELPFRVGPGYEAPVADLQGAGGIFATLDYSDEPPRVFIGGQCEAAELKLSNLRDPSIIGGAATGVRPKIKAFQCPSCAASLTIRAEQTETLACGSCNSIIDISDENFRILSAFKAKKQYKPAIPLGSKGKLHGAEYEVIGYLRREIEVDGTSYDWSEYLLSNPKEGFRWLSEYNGHWNFIRNTRQKPEKRHNTMTYLGKHYKHFQTASAKVTYVVGEFYWQVKVGETAITSDYVCPPLMLSEEKTDNEVTWSLSEYMEPKQLWEAFKLPGFPPFRLGVYANQPSPHSGKVWPVWKLAGIFSLVLLVVQIGFLIFSGNKLVYQQTYRLLTTPQLTQVATAEGTLVPVEKIDSGTMQFKALTTDAFTISGRLSNVALRHTTDVNNNWVYVGMTLVEEKTGAAYSVGREIGYYYGSDDGESWHEGSQNDEAVLKEIPAGRYHLTIEAEADGNSGVQHPPIACKLQIYRDVPTWSNFWLALGGLLLFPILAWWRSRSFEVKRWNESDHPIVSSGSD